MASFVSPSDFNVLPYSIANLSEDGYAPTLQLMIDEIVPATLKKILGLTLYKEFVEGVDLLPFAWSAEEDYDAPDEVYYGVTIWRALQPIVASDTPPSEGADWTKVEDNVWLKLRDGSEYVYPNGNGSNVAYEYSGVKPFLIPLVYKTWLERFAFDTQTDAGVVASDLENAGNNGIRDRAVKCVNASARLVGSNAAARNTLWGFLYTTYETDYPDLSFCPLPKANYFDL